MRKLYIEDGGAYWVDKEGDHIYHAATETDLCIRVQALETERDALAAELAQERSDRQREHDLRVTLAGELESFKIRYQDEVSARVDAENERDTLRAGYVAELRKAKAELAADGSFGQCDKWKLVK